VRREVLGTRLDARDAAVPARGREVARLLRPRRASPGLVAAWFFRPWHVSYPPRESRFRYAIATLCTYSRPTLAYADKRSDHT
jgi:hypothetical protein